MKNLFEASVGIRSLCREKTAALVSDWELLMWLNHAVADVAKRTLCYERETILGATDNIRIYDWKYVLPDFGGKVRAAWYRNYPMELIQDVDAKFLNQAYFNSTSSQPREFYYDSQRFGLKWIPDVATYSTGTATFTVNSTAVTGAATLWNTGTNAGVHFAIGNGADPGKFYSIRSIESDTALTLEEPYREATAAGASYLITDGAIRLHYVAIPAALRTISYVTAMAATITVTNGSRTVTTSGAPAWLTNARRGMHFGVGTTTETTRPSKWYIIRKVVSNTELELAQPYEEATAAGTANGVLTEDSPFEPTLLETAVAYATAMALRKYNHPESAGFLQMYEARVAQTKAEVDARYNRHSLPPRIIDSYWGNISELDS